MKALYFKKGFNKNGGEIVDGAVKIFLRKPYGKTEMFTTRDVTSSTGNTRTVTNLEGSIKLDEYMAKQVKYFFNVDLAADTYLNVRVGVWGSMGKAIAKFNLKDGDCYMFLLSNAKMDGFTKKDGSTGYQLNANAFDFEPIRTDRAQNGNAAQKSNAGSQPAQDTGFSAGVSDDFAAIEDSEDMPF